MEKILFKRISIVVIGLVFLLNASSCQNNSQSGSDQSPATFDGSQWKLISLDGGPLVSGSYFSLYFRNGTVWGSSGINIYGGKYTLKDPDGLTFSEFMSTLIGGPDDLVRQEGAFFDSLLAAGLYRVEGTSLKIYNASSPKSLVFERLPEYAMNQADLVGTKWQLSFLKGEPVLEGLSITLNFDNDSQASGLAGCFEYKLPYEGRLYKPKGDDLRWGIISGRIGALPRELETQALDYTGSIVWAADYRLIPDHLEIYTAREKL